MVEWLISAILGVFHVAPSSTDSLISLLCVLAMSASMAFAQSEWKEIPVGYNMPKSVMAVASLSTMEMAMAAPPTPKAATKKYYGQERDPYHKWEVEFHGGGFWNFGGVSGQSMRFPQPRRSPLWAAWVRNPCKYPLTFSDLARIFITNSRKDLLP